MLTIDTLFAKPTLGRCHYQRLAAEDKIYYADDNKEHL